MQIVEILAADPIAQILAQSKVIAVVGLSAKPHRASYEVAAYLQAVGYRIVPVNPKEAGKRILGETVFASLTTAAAEHHIDVVNCFRKSEDIPAIVDEVISIGLPCIWMQLGIMHASSAQKAEAVGISVIMDKCIKIEHQIRR
ncbi:MAG: CoA-binding protein [Burkholderiales bacterium]|nr:CoA-binding protein [Burkholderiales bacterium]